MEERNFERGNINGVIGKQIDNEETMKIYHHIKTLNKNRISLDVFCNENMIQLAKARKLQR